jgi:hypothetical protein
MKTPVVTVVPNDVTGDAKVTAMDEEPPIHEHLLRCWSCFAPSEDLRTIYRDGNDTGQYLTKKS